MEFRRSIYESLRLKMEAAGFIFEKEQKPHLQKRKEFELVFTHLNLLNKFQESGFKVSAQKYYIKPLSDNPNCQIGLVTGKTSPLYKIEYFVKPNATDTFDQSRAWSNFDDTQVLDRLLSDVKGYLSSAVPVKDDFLGTYLFTWNPQKWDWIDLDDNIVHLKNIGYITKRWSCGNSKNIRKGDRIFLVRLGEEPKGIMGSGYAKSSYYTAPHWDGTKNKTANYIDIEFDVLINHQNNKLFDKAALNKIDSKGVQQWFPQQSGISIKNELIENLESKWLEFISNNKLIGQSYFSNDVTVDISETFIEGKAKEVTQTRYERNPRARKLCLDHHGYSCHICDFNFEQVFGEIGKGFIHVHHINPISGIGKEYAVDFINDLIPVCPNCHSMIHAKRPAFSIDEIKSLRKMPISEI